MREKIIISKEIKGSFLPLDLKKRERKIKKKRKIRKKRKIVQIRGKKGKKSID